MTSATVQTIAVCAAIWTQVTKSMHSTSSYDSGSLAPRAEADLFAGAGEVRAHARTLDWATTPLGPAHAWPVELRSAVRLMLAAPIATSLWCGPEYTLLYNDTYARILGGRHPDALGRIGGSVLGEIWPDLERQLAQVRGGGAAIYSDEARVTLEEGEEGDAGDRWFTYALSPVTDATGACIAVYVVSVEITDKIRAREALAGERTRLFQAFEQVPSFVSVLTGRDHQIQYANEAYFTLLGRRDIIGRPLWDAVPDARGQGFEALLDSVRDTGVPVSGKEMPLRLDRTPGGEPEERYIDFVYQTLTDAHGTAWGMMGYGTDVTDHVHARRRVERLLDESEVSNHALQEQAAEMEAQTAELQSIAAELEQRTAQAEEERARASNILETMADAHFVLDAEFRFISVNAATERTLFHTREQLLGRVIWEAFPATLGTIFEESYRKVAREGVELHFMGEYDDGTLDLVPEIDAYPTAEGGVAVFWRDIAPRMRTEAELRASEQRMRDVFDQAPVAVAVLTGPDHVYTTVSPLYAQTPGLGRVLLGRSMREAFPEIVAEGFVETLDRVYETGEPYSATERLVRLARPTDGQMEERYFNIGYQPIRDAQGKVYAIASAAYDVTTQVRARHEVEKARADAEEANAAKSEFLSTMSHELRTPLNAISGYTDLLSMELRGPLTEAQRADLERIRRANQHLTGLVTDVLNFTRLDAGQVEFSVVDVELGELLQDIEALIGPQLAAKGLSFSREGCATDSTGQPHRMRADPEKVRQILLNVLTNAVKFTDAGGRVVLACESDDGAGVVQVRISDTGRGVAADQLERIFEPFVQVDRQRTQESQQGVGLGLAISRDLARAMGGELTAASTPGVGSTFTLVLPAAGRTAS